MKSFTLLSMILVLGSISETALAAEAVQPPMNEFNQAFYKCDGGDAFMMSYDAEDARTATLAGNNGNKRHELKRMPSPNGVQYAGDHVTFWTDGKTARVEGAVAFKNCRMKTG